MTTCFVIQPFDKSTFDKRFEGVYKPAIEAAGLVAYRVDQDPAADVPIDAIENGIQTAEICLADITTDNPNVWYELGYSFATSRPVVMVCGPERTNGKFPFDIQHRAIITYQSDAPGDFSILQTQITSRIRAALTKGKAIRQLAESEQLATSHGLSPPETLVLAIVAAETGLPGSTYSQYRTAKDAGEAGLTGIGFALAIRRLLAKKFVIAGTTENYDGESYNSLELTNAAWDWIEKNDSLFVLKRSKATGKNSKFDDFDDNIPF